MIEKDKVRESFARAIPYYDSAALPQKWAADEVMRLILEKAGNKFDRILELGCGTGYFTLLSLDKLQARERYVNDLCPEVGMIVEKMGQSGLQFIAGDAETLPFDGQFDLICACSVIQWFNNPREFFNTCKTKLNSGGYIAFSTFCTQNMYEVKQLTGVGLKYYDTDWYKSCLEADFEILELRQDVKRLHFESPKAVLKHIKMTGAGMGGFKFTPRKYAEFEKSYKDLFFNNGRYSLTYNPLYIIAQKK